ncbi:hypothetical protein KC19_5G174800 [Ceratodon purpureus]|uniref:Uncharacterized protein n=2 Tax=Ceratodon purpureus TaxID=3225 RepID=A0A8T0I5M7_CERPU|nr:hypothetical protein KC19_5G174800 [Ceratodon purpureus]
MAHAKAMSLSSGAKTMPCWRLQYLVTTDPTCRAVNQSQQITITTDHTRLWGGAETMNKGDNAGGQGGGVGNFGPGGVAGPTAAAAAQAAQWQRSLLQRADADIGSLLDNFSHLLKAARLFAPMLMPANVAGPCTNSNCIIREDGEIQYRSELRQSPTQLAILTPSVSY